jgi:hypothetical protein
VNTLRVYDDVYISDARILGDVRAAHRLVQTIFKVSPLSGEPVIIDHILKGARTKGLLVDKTGFHRNTVGYHLDVLEAGDVIQCIHEPTALYELETDPREDS